MKKHLLKVCTMALSLLLGGNALAQDPNFYIFLCFGQSNMEGQGEIESQDRNGVPERFQKMLSGNCSGSSKGTWTTAVPPQARCNTGLCPVDYFGRTLAENLPEEISIGTITVAVGGASIDLFDTDKCQSYISRQESWMQNFAREYDSNPYKRLIELAKEAQKSGVIKGILLHQGETNTGDQSWPQNVNKIYKRMLNDLGLDAKDVPLLVGEVVQSNMGGQCGSHNAIIDNIQNTIPTAYPISSAGLNQKGDGLHFTSASYRTLGKRYAEKMLELLGEIEPEPLPERTPFGGEAASLPGKVEAEEFDEGGERVAFHDLDTELHGDGTRKTAVDVEKCDSGEALGYTQKGEWLLYTVNATVAGEYDCQARVSSGTSTSKFHLEMDDEDFTGTINVPKTGDNKWDNYQLIPCGSVTLDTGLHTLKLSIDADWLNMDYILLTTETKGDPSYILNTASNAKGIPAGKCTVMKASGQTLGTVEITTPGDYSPLRRFGKGIFLLKPQDEAQATFVIVK